MSSSNVIPYDTNVSNFVSMKLLGKQNYLLWKAQILCVLNTVNVRGILDDTFVGPDPETVTQYDNLVRGWIFGSVSEDVLAEVYNLDSAKAVWEKLRSNYDQPTRSQEEEEIAMFPDVGTSSERRNPTKNKGVTIKVMETKDEHKNKLKILKSLVTKGDWPKIESMLKEDKGLTTEAISRDGSTILHIAVGVHQNKIVQRLINILDDEQVRKKRDSDGSTALHVAAIVGNIDAAKMLFRRRMRLWMDVGNINVDHDLLRIRDHNGKEPWQKAYDNMHLDTVAHLFKIASNHNMAVLPNDKFAINILANTISAKRYDLALEFMKDYTKNVASKTDEVLMALAKTFPSGLRDGEKLFYPSPKSILEMVRKTAFVTINLFVVPVILLHRLFTTGYFLPSIKIACWGIFVIFLTAPLFMLASAFAFVCLLILIACFPFFLLYFFLWKGANILAFPPIKKIENKIKERDAAKNFLVLVCDKIDQLNYSGTHHPCYTRPILEAACQDAYDVVEEILSRSPEAIQSRDENGYDIIQLAIINHSEKIYNLIYDVDERKNHYKTYKDSSKNNILHLAGRLAPSSVLNQRTGATLQLQRELQWREEVKKLVIPTYITEENIFKETPSMVFTREHIDIVKEGEQWMKTTSESCSIIAALIATIVFAAVITVPGGNNQDGTPLFKKEIAFIIFAISDAISLFASTTSLLVFLSILTARYDEKDFLVSLPWRLFIGLFSLLLSTTTMMIAFSATLFIVFCDKKLWMLTPICGLACIPIAFFVGLQLPLMIDLFITTNLPIFEKERKSTAKSLTEKMQEYIFDFIH